MIPLLSLTSSNDNYCCTQKNYLIKGLSKILFLITFVILIVLSLINLSIVWNTCKLENLLPRSLSQKLNRLIEFNLHYHKFSRPFLIANSYGLFARMTIQRPEIQIQASVDGKVWKNYEFKYKLNNINQPLRQVAPHQPRLDWQMWFAALRGTFPDRGWLPSFILRLLQGNKSVTSLLKSSPYKQKPKYIRALLIFYEFENSDSVKSTWKKIDERMFLGPVQLSDNDSRGDVKTDNSRH